MTQALTKYNSPALLSVNEMMSIGTLFAESGLFTDIRGAAQATTKIIAGQELGIPPFAAMNGFHIIKGKAAMGANLIGATIKRSGKYDYIVREMTPERCLIEFFQSIDGKRESIGKSDFTLADAKKAGTQNLDKYPRNMLFARAMSNGARWYTPDVFLGPIYTPEELGATVDEAGDVIPSTSYEQSASPPATSKQRGYIAGLQNDLGWHSEYMAQFAKEHSIDLVAMTMADASYLIEQMRAALDEPAKVAEELKAPSQPAADNLTDLQSTVKALRECERQHIAEPPKFTQTQAQSRQALGIERSASMARIYGWLLSKTDAETAHQLPSLEELDDKSLIDLAYAASGL